jgi:hypothetical protein
MNERRSNNGIKIKWQKDGDLNRKLEHDAGGMVGEVF